MLKKNTKATTTSVLMKKRWGIPLLFFCEGHYGLSIEPVMFIESIAFIDFNFYVTGSNIGASLILNNLVCIIVIL